MDKNKQGPYTNDDMAMRIPALSDIVFRYVPRLTFRKEVFIIGRKLMLKSGYIC